MGTQKTRTQLENAFSAGKTPSGSDYSDLFASFYNKLDDSSSSGLKLGRISYDGGDLKSVEIDGTSYSDVARLCDDFSGYDIVIVQGGDDSGDSTKVLLVNEASASRSDLIELPDNSDSWFIFIKSREDQWVKPSFIYQ